VEEQADGIVLVGHNPGLSLLVLALCGQPAGLAPASLAHLQLPAPTWRQVAAGAGGELLEIWAPVL